jgi:molecular chaperone GrpE
MRNDPRESTVQDEDGVTRPGAADSADAPPTEAGPEASSSEGGAVDEWKDKFLRAKADLVNFQRRAERERQDALRYAHAGLVKSLLPAVDDLERVIQSASEGPASSERLVDGVKMTLANFEKILREHQVTGIEAAGQPFDPEFHEAVMEQPSPEHTERTVLQVVGRGYKLHDRVLRPAKVIVSKPAQ